MLSTRLSNATLPTKSFIGARNSYGRTLLHTTNSGKRVEGERNLKKHHDPLSTAPSSARSEFDPKRSFKYPVDPKSNPEDCAPHEDTSGAYSRSGMRSAEYSSVEKKEEPYSPPGGEHRYGGTKRYEWNVKKNGE